MGQLSSKWGWAMFFDNNHHLDFWLKSTTLFTLLNVCLFIFISLSASIHSFNNIFESLSCLYQLAKWEVFQYSPCHFLTISVFNWKSWIKDNRLIETNQKNGKFPFKHLLHYSFHFQRIYSIVVLSAVKIDFSVAKISILASETWWEKTLNPEVNNVSHPEK